MNFNKDQPEETRTIYCGNLHENVTEELLHKLFVRAGPLEKIQIPKDADGRPQSYALITYRNQCSVVYAINNFGNNSLLNNRLNLQPHKVESVMATNPSMFTQTGPQFKRKANVNMAPSFNNTPSLQGQGQDQPHNNENDMRPNDNNGSPHKQRKL